MWNRTRHGRGKVIIAIGIDVHMMYICMYVCMYQTISALYVSFYVDDTRRLTRTCSLILRHAGIDLYL